MEQIKKCPWCGCSSVVRPSAIGYFVECSKNGHVHNVGRFGFEKSYRKTDKEAINTWNNFVNAFIGGANPPFSLAFLSCVGYYGYIYIIANARL